MNQYSMAKKDTQAPKYSKETYTYWYESMQLQRKFEEKCPIVWNAEN